MSDRISWIDDAKMFAMFCVVFGHVSGLFSNKLVGFYPINTAIVSFNMPLFVFCLDIQLVDQLIKSNHLEVYGIILRKWV